MNEPCCATRRFVSVETDDNNKQITFPVCPFFVAENYNNCPDFFLCANLSGFLFGEADRTPPGPHGRFLFRTTWNLNFKKEHYSYFLTEIGLLMKWFLYIVSVGEGEGGSIYNTLTLREKHPSAETTTATSTKRSERQRRFPPRRSSSWFEPNPSCARRLLPSGRNNKTTLPEHRQWEAPKTPPTKEPHHKV